MTEDPTAALKLTALDAEDLEVISAQMQDSTLLVGDITYLPKQKKLALVANVRRDLPEGVLSLLAILFHPDEDPPGGVIELTFSGGGALRAEVECIEVALDDLGVSWETPRKPAHVAAGDTELGSEAGSRD